MGGELSSLRLVSPKYPINKGGDAGVAGGKDTTLCPEEDEAQKADGLVNVFVMAPKTVAMRPREDSGDAEVISPRYARGS